MGVTILDVAERTGLSIGTVSLALHNSSYIREKTKLKVQDAAKELNYRVRVLGRALVLQRTHTIGLVIVDVSNPFFAELTQAVERVAHKNGFNVILGNTRYDVEEEKAFIETLMGGKVEGMIIDHVEGGTNYDYFEQLKREKIPFVLLRKVKGVDADYVMANDEDVSYKLTQHMINLGYRSIGYIGSVNCGDTDHDRFTGYKRALRDNGIEYNEALIRETNPKIEDGYRTAKSLLMSPWKPRAIIVFCDILAIGVVRAAKEMGINVPKELAVGSFDDIEFAAYCEVPLTTMALPKYKIGVHATELLLKRIKQKRENIEEGPKEAIILEAKLVIRDSCGASRVSDMKK